MSKPIRLVLVAAIACALGAPAWAEEPPAGSVVTAVQSPAWLVHGGAATPLKPGMQVSDGDTLRTAAGGRVYVQLPEHSMVKLGENTEFMTPTMQMAKDEQGSMFKSVLHVLKGVFRFTTSLVGKSERRHVDIQVGVATIGIRGTDVWGRAGNDGSLVALLEGKAEMNMPGHATMMMEQPMHYNMMPTGGEMQMNMEVTPDKVADWAAQTDVAAGTGVLTGDGKWVVALVSSTSDADTARLMRRLAAAGYPSEDVPVTVNGAPWHRLVIRQAASYKDAVAIAAKVGKTFPLMSPWVYKPR
ncbi:MAG TPA: FecR domain-containing protein [Gammaproteobacteria bacterium]|jgi:hypothetical protein|nr:FecR domain-containing protein [Gammaproteobacteria bacterium]